MQQLPPWSFVCCSSTFVRSVVLHIVLGSTVVSLSGQYTKIRTEGDTFPSLSIVQIDFREFSTLIHFQYTNDDLNEAICVNENTHLADKTNSFAYNLLNAINIPLCENVHVFNNSNRVLNFTLEFEKMSDETTSFNILNMNSKYGQIRVTDYSVDDYLENHGYLDIQNFVGLTPAKENGTYFQHGNAVKYYKHNGLNIIAMITYEKRYGKYYQINFLIHNFTGRNIDVNPTRISAKYINSVGAMDDNKNLSERSKKRITDDIFYEPTEYLGTAQELTMLGERWIGYDAQVLSHKEYMKRIKRRQGWNDFAVSFSEGLAASNAGYSTKVSSSSAYIFSNSYGHTSGYVGNVRRGTYSGTSSIISVNSSSVSRSYNGYEAYLARQMARDNLAEFRANQFQIKNRLSDGYLKRHTIMDQSEYIGFVNIPFMKAEMLHIKVPIGDEEYIFTWENLNEIDFN